jgi:hypothetical protein
LSFLLEVICDLAITQFLILITLLRRNWIKRVPRGHFDYRF